MLRGFARELGVACFGLLRHNSTTTWMQLPVPMRPNLSFYLLACLRARPYQTSSLTLKSRVTACLSFAICIRVFAFHSRVCPSSHPVNFLLLYFDPYNDSNDELEKFFKTFLSPAYYDDNDRCYIVRGTVEP